MNTRLMKAALLAALLPLAGYWTMAARAAPAPEAAPAQDPESDRPAASADEDAEAQPEEDGVVAGPGAAAAGDAPEVFIPSEEISEDYAVSFPVDI